MNLPLSSRPSDKQPANQEHQHIVLQCPTYFAIKGKQFDASHRNLHRFEDKALVMVQWLLLSAASCVGKSLAPIYPGALIETEVVCMQGSCQIPFQLQSWRIFLPINEESLIPIEN